MKRRQLGYCFPFNHVGRFENGQVCATLFMGLWHGISLKMQANMRKQFTTIIEYAIINPTTGSKYESTQLNS